MVTDSGKSDYLISLEALASWFPNNPGLAVGLGHMSFGIGTIVSASIFDMFISRFGIVNAFFLSGFLMFIPTLLVSFCLDWPERTREFDFWSGDELKKILDYDENKISSWRELVGIPQFWLFCVTLLCAQGAYSIIPYFYAIGISFGSSMDTLVRLSQIMNFASFSTRLLVGCVTDHFKMKKGFFAMGSKNILMAVLSLQSICCLLLIPISMVRWFQAFVIISGFTFATFAGACCVCSLLAREQFGSNNSSMVFGIGGSLSMGLGEVTSISMMRFVERQNEVLTGPSDFNLFYLLAAIISLLGLLCCLRIQKYKRSLN